MSPGIARTLARKLIRAGVPADRVRARIAAVFAEDGEDAQNMVEKQNQLIAEAFTELRYMSMLGAMRKEMPHFPLPPGVYMSNDDDDDLDDEGPAGRPTVPRIVAEEMRKRKKGGKQVAFPIPAGKGPGSRKGVVIDLPGAPRQQGRLRRLFGWMKAEKAEREQSGHNRRRPIAPPVPPRPLPQLVVAREAGMWPVPIDELPSRARDPMQEVSLSIRPGTGDGRAAADLTPQEARFVVSRMIRSATDLLNMPSPGTQSSNAHAHQLAVQALAIFRVAHGLTGGEKDAHQLLVPVLNVRAFTALLGGDFECCRQDLMKINVLLDGMDCTTEGLVVFSDDPLAFQPRRERIFMLSTKTRFMLQSGDLDATVNLARQTLDLMGDETLWVGGTPTISLILAHALSLLGRTEEADEEFRKALQASLDNFSPNSAMLVPYLQMMALFAKKQQNYDDAKVFSAIAYRNLHGSLGDSHPRTMYSMQQVAEIYLRTRQYREAATWLITLQRLFTEHMKSTGKPPIPLHYAKALHLLCLAYLGLNRTRSAMNCATTSLRLHERHLPVDSPQMREPLMAWATAFRMAGMHGLGAAYIAIAALDKALALAKKAEKEASRPNTYTYISDGSYTLEHLVFMHLWEGEIFPAECRWHEIEARLPSLNQVDLSILQTGLAASIRVLHTYGSFPADIGKGRPADNLPVSFLHCLAGFCLSAGAILLYRWRAESPNGSEQEEGSGDDS
eukprot:Hpha_TRINITY_DN13632_c1_g1::TRINITY_DN13632_c1_g1_i1::g.122951::m.122951